MDEKKQELAPTQASALEKSFKENVDTMIANRDYFKSQLESIMVESQDYHVIKGKKSLSKGGAEKLATGFKLQAKFIIDEEAKKAFSEVKGLIAYRCQLFDMEGKFKGEGGGADTLARNSNDPNKTIKMAQKRAYVDAVIRTTGLSDIFTQDLEDMDRNAISDSKQVYTPKSAPTGQKNWNVDPHKPASDKQKWLIRKLLTDMQLSEEWIEKKAGKIDSMKMGVASQVLDQLNKKKAKQEELPTVDYSTGEVVEAKVEEVNVDLVDNN